MPRTKIVTRKQAQSQKADRDEKVRLAQIKIDSALVKIDELATRYKKDVDNQIKLIRDTADEQLLQMKWSDFMGLKISHFAEQPFAVPKPPATRSLSFSRQRGRSRTPQQQPQQARPQVQSVDRARRNEAPSMTFLRWPREGEMVFSEAGSPLAVQRPLERCADVHIPTKKGVVTVKPQKMKQVEREALMNLDQNTLNQVKTLNTNLGMIVDMATKMKL